MPAQRVAFGTSGHRGSSFEPQLQRSAHPRDHARRSATTARRRASTARCSSASTRTRCPRPRCASALEVLAANGVDVDARATATSTRRRRPCRTRSSCYNRGRTTGLADGIVVTPSHNPPDNGGFKYNPPNGGPADDRRHRLDRGRARTRLLDERPEGRAGACRSRRRARAATTHRHDYLDAYVARSRQRHRHRRDPRRRASAWASIRSAAPACTTGRAIAERYGLDLTVVNDDVDPTFRFMTRRLGRPDPHGSVVAVRDAAR